MKDDPLVSICIPAYNAEKYIAETITCLLRQEYKNIEILVVDDHSTDRTWEILQDHNQERIQIARAIGKGAAAARNQAFKMSQDSFIVFFDADDLVSSNFIQTQVNTAVKDINAVVVSCWGRFYGSINTYKEDHQIIKENLTFYEWIIRYWTFYRHTTPPGRIMVPGNVLLNAGLWNESVTLNDDFEFFTRVFNCSSFINYNNDGILYYRSGINGLSSSKSSKANTSYYKTLELALGVAQKRFPGEKLIARACANLWKMFIYHVFPFDQDLISAAEKEIKKLGGADIPFPAGGMTKVMTTFLGWKMAKKFKIYYQQGKGYQPS